MSPTRDIPADSWSRYWKHGFVTSCSTSFRENYEGPLLASWQRFFDELPANARILDIGTGNGAIAILANEASCRKAKHFEIHGIDKAAIDPQTHVKAEASLLRGIQFHGGTACERSGFPGEYFDAVTGQYALEYTRMEEALPEIRRICRPGAHIMFIMHHARSVVMEISRQEINDASLIFDETQLFDRAEALIRRVGKARSHREREALSGDPQAEALRHAFNESAGILSEAIKRSPQPDLLKTGLSYVTRAYKSVEGGGLDRALTELREGEAELRAHAGRLQDLLRSAVSDEKLAWVANCLQTLGFTVDPPVEIRHDEQTLMGWRLKAKL